MSTRVTCLTRHTAPNPFLSFCPFCCRNKCRCLQNFVKALLCFDRDASKRRVQKSSDWFRAHSFRLLSKHGLSVEPSPSFLEHDSGSGSSCPRLLFAQGRSVPACRPGRGASCPCLFRVEMARRREIPQICRQPGKPGCLLTSAATQQPSLSTRSCRSESSDRKRQSQQQTDRPLVEICTDTN